jgi:tetratricopeptide (TPR) repeat protein
VSVFESLIRVNPRSYLAYYSLGRNQLETKETEKARAAFQSSVEINPDFDPAWVGLAGSLEVQGRYDEAVQVYQRALANDPQDREFRERLAQLHLRRGDLDSALAAYEELRRADPANVAILTRIGQIQAREERLRQGSGDLPRRPPEEPGTGKRASPWAQPGVDEALRRSAGRAGQAAAKDPRYVDALLHRGYISRPTERFDEATAVFTEAARLCRRKERAVLPGAHVHAEEGLRQGVAGAGEGGALDPNNVSTITSWGRPGTARQLDQAERVFRKVCRWNRITPTPTTTSGTCLRTRASSWKKRWS